MSQVFCTILQEAAQHPISLLSGDAPRRPVFGRQSGSHLSERDLGNQDGVLRMGIGDSPYPRTARLICVAFHHGAGIKIVIGHGAVPRCSRMISLSEEPGACVRIWRTSSSVTPGMILPRRVGLRGRIRPAACSTSRVVGRWAASRARKAISRSSRPSASGAWPLLRACSSSRLEVSGGRSIVIVLMLLSPRISAMSITLCRVRRKREG